MLSGLGFLPGRGDLPREDVDVCEDERTGPEGTLAFWARRAGFLWVISEGSTLLRCDVTAEPRAISSKTAPISPVPPLEVDSFVGIGGRGGASSKLGSGGGGGGAAADDGGGVFEDDTPDCTS